MYHLCCHLYHFLQQSFAGVFEQFNHQFEITVTAIVRIRDSSLSGMVSQVVCHAHNLLPVGVKGDVNGDTNITIADVSKLIDYLLTGSWD